MVRVNLIPPWCLTDQHLIAEYREILLLLGYIRRHPTTRGIPSQFRLGEGHMRFFKDKCLYLQHRHLELVTEMRKRGFHPKIKASLRGISKQLRNNWNPNSRDIQLVTHRIISKIKAKPGFYRYYGVPKPSEDLISLIQQAI